MSRRSKRKLKNNAGPTGGGKSSTPAAASGRQSPADGLLRKTAQPRWKVPGICAVLVIMVFIVFGQTARFEFVNYDDGKNVFETPQITAGLSLHGIGWAFTHTQVDRWTPIATLSRMADCQFFGLWSGGHHLTNVLLHALASVLVFLMLRTLTGFQWRSGFVAAVFAVHPLHVESVAWVSARGELLCGVFFLLSLWSYTLHARKAEFGLQYALAIFFFALGLMSKPTIVTLPFVLLLLDYWPLRRFGSVSWLRLIAEKIPFLVLSAATGVVAYIVEPKLYGVDHLPLGLRIQNALVSLCIYLRQTLWPAGLAAWYPNTTHGFPLWELAGSFVLLCVISIAAYRARNTHPALLIGWLWFAGMLVPVIGIVQISNYAHADRYTYLPEIGLWIALTWIVADSITSWQARRVVLGGVAVIALSVFLAMACKQASCWRDSFALWSHALECTEDNFFARNNLGVVLFQRGQIADAVAEYRDSLRINPGYAEPHYNLGNALLQQGQSEGAIAEYRESLRINPTYVEPHYNLGNALLQRGRSGEAIAEYREALKANPDYAEAHNNLGLALVQRGQIAEAIVEYRDSLRINPNYADAHYNLGIALFRQGETAEAIIHTQKALEFQPSNFAVQNHLAWMLATAPQMSLRDGGRALELATKANEATSGGNFLILRTLAAAHAAKGEFSVAAQIAHTALQLAEAQSEKGFADELRREIKLYEAGRSFEDAR